MISQVRISWKNWNCIDSVSQYSKGISLSVRRPSLKSVPPQIKDLEVAGSLPVLIKQCLYSSCNRITKSYSSAAGYRSLQGLPLNLIYRVLFAFFSTCAE
ncbi:hypothetical protein NPIL_699981 [Nephila pilipes]|uniref:Uncharacterized protein n=1 Tax=Nephila pilipes TaxID=299642 RepID=A0A8X6JM47_NEPPI|nr:hypothetical protein NPIL_699981 [Nephila pilipes]